MYRPVDFEAAILEQQEYESGECGGVYPGIEKFDPYGPQCEECCYSGGQHSIGCIRRMAATGACSCIESGSQP